MLKMIIISIAVGALTGATLNILFMIIGFLWERRKQRKRLEEFTRKKL